MPNDPLSPSATHAGVQWENQRPLRAVRHHCLDCARSSAEVALCPATACPLWAMRYGRRPTEELKAAQADVDLHPLERPKTGAEFHDGGSALQAIKRRCFDCAGSTDAVKNCASGPGSKNACDLWALRLGKNPNYSTMSDETRAKIGLPPRPSP